MPGHKRYIYRSLRSDGRTIRLIRILSTTSEGYLSCEITTETTEETFTALSYTWGPSTHDFDILVNNKLFRVRRNLWDFLNLARCNYASRKFWVDAICIDQGNDLERTQQVRMMSRIYECAQNTIIWLGDFESKAVSFSVCDMNTHIKIRSFDPELSQCLVKLRMIHHNQSRFEFLDFLNRDHLGHDFVRVSAVLQRICDHPYWERLWVIQEIKLSRRHKYILCGSLLITWTLLVEILDHTIGSKYTQPRTSFFRVSSLVEDDQLDIILANEQKRYNRQIGIQATGTVKRVARQHESSSKVWSVPSLRLGSFARQRLWQRFNASHARELTCPRSHHSFNGYSYHGISESIPFFIGYEGFKCADRRDKLYGLGHLWGGDNAFPADYSIDVYDLYFRACRVYADRVFRNADQNDPYEQQIPASWVTDTADILRHLEMGVLDLVFGDPQGRTRVMKIKVGHTILAAQQKCLSLNVMHGRFTGTCPRCEEDFYFDGHPTPVNESYCIIQCHDHYDVNTRYNAGYERQHVVAYFIVDEHPDALHHFANRTISSFTGGKIPTTADVEGMRSGISLQMLGNLMALHSEFPPRPPGPSGTRRARDTTPALRHKKKSNSLQSPQNLFDELRYPSAMPPETTCTHDMLDEMRLETIARERLMVWLEEEGVCIV